MSTVINLIIQLVSGLGAGNAAGALMKDKPMSTLGNSVTGLVGGGLGGIVTMLIERFSGVGTAAASGLDFGSIIGSILGGGIGGGVLTAIVAYFKKNMDEKKRP